MKKAVKILSALMMALIMTLGLSTTALAADDVPTITFTKEGMSFTNISTDYTESDLFNNYKGVMPGDKLDQHIVIKNNCRSNDFLKIYMYVLPHDAEKNIPLSMDQFPESEQTVAQMNEFLSHLELNVWDNQNKEGEPFFSASANEDGGLTEEEPAYLGKIRRGKKLNLTAEMLVPLELDNDYQKYVGEVDWVFYAVGGNDPTDPEGPDDDDEIIKVKKVWEDGGNGHPDYVEVKLYDGDKLEDTVRLSEKNDWRYTWRGLDEDGDWRVEESPVKGFKASYDKSGSTIIITNTSTGDLIQTGQLNWPIPVMLGLGLILIILGVISIRRKKNNRA